MNSKNLGIQGITEEDRNYQGSRYTEVKKAVFSNPYQKVWGAPNEPSLPQYEVTFPDNSMPIEFSIMILKGLHGRWVGLMETLPPESWTRSAIHPEVGDVTLEGLLETYANHGENHVKQITDLRKAKDW